MNNLHEGHRKRMKDKFLENGLSGFEDHEILEILLFFGIQRVNTNDISHRLINKFGNIPSVFNAPIEELENIKGMTKNAAILIKLVPQVLQFYFNEVHNEKPLDSLKAISNYFVSTFLGKVDEELKVCCLDNNLHVISCVTVAEGTVNASPVNARKIIEATIRSNSSIVILAHNHPNGNPIPSDNDIRVTREMVRILSSLGVELLDHVIVGKNAATSMKHAGYFNILD
ncbi:MAG: DNA repair protein RadC [Clostridiales bacterium]|nr:DNA repair protein RadC [Clostridiales bacterium]